MSGIVAVLNTAGSPVDRTLLDALTASLRIRGPDGHRTWSEGCVGLGHTLLAADDGSARDVQPCTLDGSVWITADARIDGRADLIRSLVGYGCDCPELLTDSELILAAYLAWGTQCLDRLIGDFAFVIWDGRTKSLFCGRDHLGIKPLFYASIGHSLVLSNSLDCIWSNPGCAQDLDDQVVGDFLLFDFSQDPSRTVFRGIKRLPGGHFLECSIQNPVPRPKKFWSLPSSGEIRYKRTRDYVDRFAEILSAAVADRIRGPQVAMFLSGGLDSSSVAAMAAKRAEVKAYTAVVDRLYPDQERYYSGVVASALEFPISYRPVDGYGLYEGWGNSALPFAEPAHLPLGKIFLDHLSEVASHSRVVLTGHGGDQILAPSPGHFVKLLREWHVRQFVADSTCYVRSLRAIPPLGIRSGFRARFGTQDRYADFPSWLEESFCGRLQLRARWQQILERPGLHPTRPAAHSYLGSAELTAFLETFDPGNTRVPIETRHPYCDVRLIKYLLAIPPVPWFPRKLIVRKAMAGRLPAEILARPKTPVLGDPIRSRLRSRSALPSLAPHPDLAAYVDLKKLPVLQACNTESVTWADLRPLSLNFWLQSRSVSAPFEV